MRMRRASSILLVALQLVMVSCGSAKKCDERSCASGCCDGTDVCRSGTSTTACGSGGKACVECSSQLTCFSGGTCSPVAGGVAAGGTAGVGGGNGSAGGVAAGGTAGAGGGTGSAGGSAGGGAVDAGCTGSCATTDLVARFGTRTATFDRAQHGVELDGRLHVEAHAGGDPACPTMTSPTPLRTLVISGLRPLTDGGVISFADGLRVSLLDFSGAVTSAPLERAIDARATARWAEPGTLVSFQLTATFDGGTLSGGFSAPHCASLDP